MTCLSPRRCLATGALVALLQSAAAAQGVLYTFDGIREGDRLGQSVSRAGDVNNDGTPDLIAGGPGDNNIGAGAGLAQVFSGATGSVLFSFAGTPGDRFGISVSDAGDVNNDGFADVVVAGSRNGPNGANSGTALVYSGTNGSILYALHGDSASDGLGRSVSGAGDVNNDGHADFLVSVGGDDVNGTDSGSARIYSGLNGSILYTFRGDSVQDGFGSSVSDAGDVNNDGHADVIVGAMGDDDNGSECGSARVHSGIDGSTLFTFFGDSAGDRLGRSVSGAGNVDGDPFDDLIVGAPFVNHAGTQNGSARVFSGSSGTILFTFEGQSEIGFLGESVGSAGDLDGDGLDDLIVGEPESNPSGPRVGKARVYSAATGGVLFEISGNSPGDLLGQSVSGAGDINHNGVPDLIVGAFREDNTGSDSGSAYVLSGNCGVISAYGQGCSGSGGFTPSFYVTGCPTPGGEVTLGISGGLGGAPVIFLAGLSASSSPLGGGCDLLVSPVLLTFSLPLTGVGDGRGLISIPIRLPMGMATATIHLQAAVIDPGGFNGYSMTGGISVHVE